MIASGKESSTTRGSQKWEEEDRANPAVQEMSAVTEEECFEQPGCADKHWVGHIIAYWLCGLFNNVIYVVMNAGAKSISSGGVGLVYAVNVAPALLVKGTLPYWFHLVSYKTRMLIVAILNALCLVLVGTFETLPVQLAGVALGATASALGEASFLGMSSLYPLGGKTEIAAWSSGTGFAGIFGYAWNIIWQQGFGFSFSTVCLTGLVFPPVWLLVYFFLLINPAKIKSSRTFSSWSSSSDSEPDLESPSALGSGDSEENWDFKAKITFVFSHLWMYIIPLFVVYFAEYAMQAGAWAAIGNPIESTKARQEMYWYLGWLYQVGVFISRTSGFFFTLNMATLWAMPVLQGLFLVFFVMNSLYHFWLDYGLLFIALITGLLGGAVYVNAFLLISKKVEPKRREFALTATSIGDTFGILLADVSGVFIQGCLYAANNLVDCTPNGVCTAPTYQCGHTFDTTFNPALL